MTLNFRAMTEYDVDSVHNIEIKAHLAPWDKKIFRDCVLIGYDCRILELDNSLVAGYVITRIKESVAHILNCCVDNRYQNKGFGKIMLQEIIQSLKHQDVGVIQLEVRPSNLVAIHLYSSLGFEQAGIKKKYYSTEDAIVFKINL